jgi:hypothetical protein
MSKPISAIPSSTTWQSQERSESERHCGEHLLLTVVQ